MIVAKKILTLIALWKAGKNEVWISTEWKIAVLTAKTIDPTIFQIVAMVPIAAPILRGAMTSLTAVIIAALLNPQLIPRRKKGRRRKSRGG